MKIGMLIPEFPTQTHIFFWREIEALRALGVEVAVISTRRPEAACPHAFAEPAARATHYVYPPNPALAARGLASPRGVLETARYVHSLSTPKTRAAGFAVCAADLATYCRGERIDHIHVHSCAEAAHVVAMAYLLGGAPYSLHLHGDLPVYGTDHPQKMHHALFVAAAARVMQQQIVDGGRIPLERTRRMTMGVDIARFQPRVHTTTRDALHVVSISRLAECKGHKFGLEAVRQAVDAGVDVHYTIGGTGPDRPAIEADVERLGLGDRVAFAGGLSEAGVTELLQRADCFLLSSVGAGEASPVAVMEAMASGIPPICSIIGGTSDMIGQDVEGLLVAQFDVHGLRDALLAMARDPERRARLGAAARARAEREFDAAVLARNLLETIRETQRSALKERRRTAL